MSPELVAVVQIIVGILSVPAVAGLLAWLGKRFTKESRLLVKLERLTAVYPHLPEGDQREHFAKRVNDIAGELNQRLDPLFKRERKMKRKVLGWVVGALVAVTVVLYPSSSATGYSMAVGLGAGVVISTAFLLIERDTRRQRALLRIGERASA